MEWISNHVFLILLISSAIAFLMAWGMGANDVANAMGTSVGSKALTIKQAILIAIVFEFCGAYFAGGGVTETIRKGVIDPQALQGSPELLVYGMMAAILASGIWMLIATVFGWPVSSTHSIIGAVVGFGAVGIGIDAVEWDNIWNIVASWIISPVIGGVISFALLRSVQRFVLDQPDPFARAKRLVPFYIGFCGFIISLVTLAKGLSHLGLDISFGHSLLMSLGIGLVVGIIGAIILSRIQPNPEADREFRFSSVENIFAVLMIFTACTMAFAHGSNDVANAIGPLAAIVSVVTSGDISAQAPVPDWVLLLGAIGIVCGLAIFGYRVMATVGTKITELTPSRGFAAELGAATTVVLASGFGLPVSTTQILVGAVLGVGLARGANSVNLRIIGTIFMSWIITLPAGAILSIIFFYIFKNIFGG